MSNVVTRENDGTPPRAASQGEPLHWVHWDPSRQMAPFRNGEELPALFAPDFEIKETNEGFVFKADVPGIREQDLAITMTGNRLTISGKREAEKEERADVYYARERVYGGFTRAFALPDGTSGDDGVRAEMSHGVLTLFLPKAPEQQPKRIEIKVADKPKAQ